MAVGVDPQCLDVENPTAGTVRRVVGFTHEERERIAVPRDPNRSVVQRSHVAGNGHRAHEHIFRLMIKRRTREASEGGAADPGRRLSVARKQRHANGRITEPNPRAGGRGATGRRFQRRENVTCPKSFI